MIPLRQGFISALRVVSVRGNTIATYIVRSINENGIAVLVGLFDMVTLEANAFDDVELPRPLPEKYPRRLPRSGQDYGGDDLAVHVQYVFVGEVYALDDPHVAVVRHARGLADGDKGLRANANRVDDKRVSLPMADRVPVEGRVRVVGMRTAVGIDPAQPVAVGLTEHRDAARREQDFHGVVSDQHPARHRLGQAIHEQRRWTARLLFRQLMGDQRGSF